MVVVDTRDHILSTFDRALSMYADEQFARQGIDVIHNSRVRSLLVLTKRVKADAMCSKSEPGEPVLATVRPARGNETSLSWYDPASDMA